MAASEAASTEERRFRVAQTEAQRRDISLVTRAVTPMVPVFNLNLLPPFMAPNSGRLFLGFSVELPLSTQLQCYKQI